MQQPSFWRQLRTDFRDLPDSVWSHEQAPDRLQAFDSVVVGGDSSIRAQFKHLAGRGGVALGASLDEAARAWLEVLRDYLEAEGSPWFEKQLSQGFIAGPTERRHLNLSDISPRQHRHRAYGEDPELSGLVDSIQQDSLGELLVVIPENGGYVVLDDDREHLKYTACVMANVTSVNCGVRSAADLGTLVETTGFRLDCITKASADLCEKLVTTAGSPQANPVSCRPMTSQAESLARTTIAPPLTRRVRVDEFLERCNVAYHGPEKIRRKHIWTLAHHSAARQFQYWQKHDKRATSADDEAFERILNMRPQDFIDAVAPPRNTAR
jgi:hypothetical protein